VRVGLIPPELAQRTRFLGDAALDGAAMLLLRRALQKTCEEEARRLDCILPGECTSFGGEFMVHLSFED
jgi:uncharacterized 2Fe-2S/4Fe-4S cluster protein (DUF4445 family)